MVKDRFVVPGSLGTSSGNGEVYLVSLPHRVQTQMLQVGKWESSKKNTRKSEKILHHASDADMLYMYSQEQ